MTTKNKDDLLSIIRDYKEWRRNEFKQKYVFNEDGSGYKDPRQDIEMEIWIAAHAKYAKPQHPVNSASTFCLPDLL